MRQPALALVALAPALGWYIAPASPLLAVAVATLAIAAALHGLGRAVGLLLGDPHAPAALAIAWGTAAYLAIGGVLVAGGWFDATGQRIVLVAGTVMGAGWLATRAELPRGPWPGTRIAPAVLAGLVAAIHIAGEAGAWHGRFFDGDLVHLDALPRLHVTGALDGAAGASRLRGLGGGVVLGSLTAAFDDWRCAHVVDRGLGLGLTLALLFVIVERAPMRLLTLFALVALTSATPELGPDLASRWSIVALILACYVSLTRATARQALPWDTLLLATAIATVTHAGVGAVVVAIGVLARRAPPGPSRRRALRRAALVVVAGAGGLVVSAITAPMLEPQWPAPANVVLWPIVAMVGHALLTLATRSLADPALQRTFTAACAMLASLGLMPTVGAAAAGALVLTIPVACLMGARLLPHHQTPGGGLIMLAMVAALATTRFPVGAPPLSWEARLVRLIDNARALSQKAIPAGGDPGHLVRQSPSQPRH